MSPRSAAALVWAAVITLLPGMLVMAPAGRFACFVIAALLAAAPAIFARKRPRLAGVVVLAAALTLLLASYPAFEAEMTRYRQRAGAGAAESPHPPPSRPPQRR